MTEATRRPPAKLQQIRAAGEILLFRRCERIVERANRFFECRSFQRAPCTSLQEFEQPAGVRRRTGLHQMNGDLCGPLVYRARIYALDRVRDREVQPLA